MEWIPEHAGFGQVSRRKTPRHIAYVQGRHQRLSKKLIFFCLSLFLNQFVSGLVTCYQDNEVTSKLLLGRLPTRPAPVTGDSRNARACKGYRTLGLSSIVGQLAVSLVPWALYCGEAVDHVCGDSMQHPCRARPHELPPRPHTLLHPLRRAKHKGKCYTSKMDAARSICILCKFTTEHEGADLERRVSVFICDLVTELHTSTAFMLQSCLQYSQRACHPAPAAHSAAPRTGRL